MEAYCKFEGDEFFIFNMHIDAYGNAGYVTHEPRRIRKLLMKRTELNKLQRKLRDVGVTVVPTRLFHLQQRLRQDWTSPLPRARSSSTNATPSRTGTKPGSWTEGGRADRG